MGVRAAFGSATPAVPGETSHCELAVENTGGADEAVRIELLGDVAAWGWVTPATLTVPAGDTAVARVTVKLPRGTRPPAGPLPVAASLTTAGDPATVVNVAGTIEVAAFADVLARLEPPVSRGRTAGRHVLTVENRGNTRLAASVTAEGEGVSVTVDPDHLELDPGSSTVAHVTAKARRPGLRGRSSTAAFAVMVEPDGAGRQGRAEGLVETPALGRTGRVMTAVLALAVLGGLGAGMLRDGGDRATTAEEDQLATRTASDCPARDHLSPDANGVVRDGVQPSFDYTFLFVSASGCRPVGFNPCQPVRYVLNRRLATDAHVADVEQAIAKLAAATGLEFEYVGTTDEDPRAVPSPRREADGSYSWPPVVIGWSHLGTGDQLRARNDGRANQDTVVSGGGRPLVIGDVIVTGNLVLNLDAVSDTDTRAPVPHGFGPGVNWGRIILHELAHVIGLGHVESRTSIMNEELTRQTISSSEWGVGDLIGLRQLGRENGCLTVPPVPVRNAPPR